MQEAIWGFEKVFLFGSYSLRSEEGCLDYPTKMGKRFCV